MSGRIVWIVLAAVTAWILVGRNFPTIWLFDADGRPHLTDFIVFWGGAKQIIAGHPTAIYDGAVQTVYQAGLISRPTNVQLVYPYPPTSFLFVWPLGFLSYTAAWLAMQGVTLAAWSYVLQRITRDWVTAIGMALAVGAATFNLKLGQNGFFTAALLVGSLLALPRDKRLSGVLLGLLSVKPHLAAAAFLGFFLWREWRALAWSIATGATMVALTTAIFGPMIWLHFLAGDTAFVGQINRNMDSVVGHTMQSVFAMAAPSYGVAAGIVVQVIAAGFSFYFVVRIKGQDQRAAALICASALLTPFLFLYDLTSLTGAAALLLRNAKSQGQAIAIAGAAALPGLCFVVWGQVGPITAFILLTVAYYQSLVDLNDKSYSVPRHSR